MEEHCDGLRRSSDFTRGVLLQYNTIGKIDSNMEEHCDELRRAMDFVFDVLMQYNTLGRNGSLLNMLMAGYSVVPVDIVFVNLHIMYIICVNNMK